jgi:hypothetical protein
MSILRNRIACILPLPQDNLLGFVWFQLKAEKKVHTEEYEVEQLVVLLRMNRDEETNRSYNIYKYVDSDIGQASTIRNFNFHSTFNIQQDLKIDSITLNGFQSYRD